jgi:transcription antitermination factor NusG
MMIWRIGQTVPLESDRDVMTDEPCGAWYIFRVRSHHELAAEAWLARVGIADAWHPTETKWRIIRAAKRKKVPYERCIAPGYVFARFPRVPKWHALFERSCGRLIGVVGYHERPLKITDKVLAQMQQVPARIQILREEEEAKERAARLARIPRAGEKARITEGPLAGRIVDVGMIDAGIARFISPLFQGIEVEMEVEKMERLQDATSCGTVPGKPS